MLKHISCYKNNDKLIYIYNNIQFCLNKKLIIDNDLNEIYVNKYKKILDNLNFSLNQKGGNIYNLQNIYKKYYKIMNIYKKNIIK